MPNQISLFPSPAAPVQHVWLRCPACAHTWLEAHIQAGQWWSAPATQIAKSPWCRCGQAPPMHVERVA